LVERYVASERFGVRAAKARHVVPLIKLIPLKIVLVPLVIKLIPLKNVLVPLVIKLIPLKIATTVLRFRVHAESEHAGSDLEREGQPRSQGDCPRVVRHQRLSPGGAKQAAQSRQIVSPRGRVGTGAPRSTG
jgi:hypothetical protein